MVVELARPLGISLPATFRHLKVLEDALLVTNDRLGKYGRCRLRREALTSAAEGIDFHRTFWNVNFVLEIQTGSALKNGDYEIEVGVRRQKRKPSAGYSMHLYHASARLDQGATPHAVICPSGCLVNSLSRACPVLFAKIFHFAVR